jgi:hypothetical protein
VNQIFVNVGKKYQTPQKGFAKKEKRRFRINLNVLGFVNSTLSEISFVKMVELFVR